MSHDPEMDPEMERLLRALRPAPPSREIQRRWARVLAHPPARAMARWPLVLPGVATALVAALLILWPERPDKRPDALPVLSRDAGAITPLTAPDRTLHATQIENRVVDAYEEGPVQMVDDVAFRPVRVHLIDTLTWEGADGVTRASYLAPREEHLLLPIPTY